MIDEIKRSVRSGKIMGAVICTIISLLFLLLFIFELRGYLAPTYNLDEIDEFNIKAGMKVRGEVDLNFGPYCYMEEENRDTGETTIKSEEYYIPLETAIIGMECEDEYQIHQMDYNYGLVESYLDGDIDDLEELEDSFMTLSVEGYIRKLSGESLQYYNEFLYEEQKDGFLPYKLEVTPLPSVGVLVIIGFFLLLFMVSAIIYTVETIWTPLPPKFKKYLRQSGDVDSRIQQLEQFYYNSNNLGGIHYSYEMIYACQNGKVRLIDTKDIVWIYAANNTIRVNLIPVAKIHSIVICLQNGRKERLQIPYRRTGDEILQAFSRVMPYVYYGYQADFINLYQKNFRDMVARKEACRLRFWNDKNRGFI